MPLCIVSKKVEDSILCLWVSRELHEIFHRSEGFWTASIGACRGILHVAIDGPDGFRWTGSFYREDRHFLPTRISRALVERL